MATPMCEDDGSLQEWAPESRLLQQIPAKAQRGIFSQVLKLTSVDVTSDFICLGTNCGLLYWYGRESGRLDRLRIENTNCSVTCVKIVSTVDFMVAAGTDIGNVTVFQIPKTAPDSIPDKLKPKNSRVERFTIDGLHKAPVTCLEWSQNGMKLFSGDKNGIVVLTSIDFQMHISKSAELLNEQFEVVQLSYYQQTLLVSTIFRTVICDGNAEWQVTQLGTKERKILGKFGATFCKFDHGVVIYASRPGLRLWLADKSGNVEQTLIFRTAVQATHPKIPLINPVTRDEPSDSSFGKLVQFGENRLITYQSEVLYVLHPGAITVIGSLNGARRILDIAVNKDEIFVLEGDRSLLRIGYTIDPYAMEAPEDNAKRRRSFILDDFATKIKDTAVGSLKRITSDFMPPSDEISPPAVADEALNLPPIVDFPKGSISNLLPEKNVEVHESTDVLPMANKPEANRNKELKDDVVISLPGKRRKPRKLHQLNQQVLGHESESDTTSTTSEDRLVCGFANELSVSEESPTSWSQSQSSFSVLRDIPSLLPKYPLHPPKATVEAPKTPEDKSQASLDTCESVSEHMMLTPEVFQDEQEKTFIRLANHEISMVDSYNSERTENMSISVNMTPSSSASSKLSDNLQSSEISENVSMISEVDTSYDSQTDAQPQDDDSNHLSLPNTSAAQLSPSAETSSTSSVNSQKVDVSQESSNQEVHEVKREIVWNKELILSQMLGLDFEDPLQQFKQSANKYSNNYEENDFQGAANSDCETPIVENHEITSENVDKFQTFPNERINNDDNLPIESNDDSVSCIGKQASLDGLSYGPPSGSSMLSSCHPSLDLNSGPAVLNNPQALIIEKSDRWLQYNTPSSLSALTVCNRYVVCIDTSEKVFYSELSGISLSWSCLDYKASSIDVSLDASLVWIMGHKGVLALVNPASKGPFSERVEEVGSNIRAITVDNGIGYFVRPDGQIKCQKKLDRFPCGQTEDVSCPWLVTDISCRNGLIAAITSDEQLICKSCTSSDFQSVSTPFPVVTSIAVGPGSLLWAVDEHSNIFFSDDYLSYSPRWWQVLISEYILQNSVSAFLNMHNRVKMGNIRANIQLKQTMIAANDTSVWVYNKFSSHIHVNKMDFTGYIWQSIQLKSPLKLVNVCVGGLFEDKGHIWLLSMQNDLFCSNPSSPNNIQSVPSASTSDIICLSSAPDTLWALHVDGTLHARVGLTDTCLIGTSWRELRLPQSTEIQLSWVSCGCDVAWAVDITGRVFITLVPPYDMATNAFDAAWLMVEGDPKPGAQFVKVFVGPHMHMVWALDSKERIYVREGIFSNYQIGTGWVYVGGIEATHLSVSSTAVWALGAGGNIYRRHGISESNYIGDYWRRVPGAVATLSAAFDDELWGINSSFTFLRLLQKHVVLEGSPSKQNVSLSECGDWEVVE